MQGLGGLILMKSILNYYKGSVLKKYLSLKPWEYVSPNAFTFYSMLLVRPTFALLGRAGPALSTPLFFMGLLGAYAHRPIKKAGRPVPRLMRELR